MDKFHDIYSINKQNPDVFIVHNTISRLGIEVYDVRIDGKPVSFTDIEQLKLFLQEHNINYDECFINHLKL